MTIKDIKEGIESNLDLKINMQARYDQNATKINYQTGTVDFKRDCDLSTGIDTLVQAVYLENSQQGKRLLETKKELISLQSSIIGDALSDESNPIVWLAEGETTVYQDKNQIGEKHASLTGLANRPNFKKNDSLVALNKDTPLAKEYVQMARTYNALLDRTQPIIKGMALWLKERVYKESGLDFDSEARKTMLSDSSGFGTYTRLKQIEAKTGPLTALRAIGVYPDSEEYLLKFLQENTQLDALSVLCDKERKNLVCICADETDIKAPIIKMDGLYIRFVRQTEFEQALYTGQTTLNDLVLQGTELKGKTFNKIKSKYLTHSFNEEQLNAIKQRALDNINTAYRFYEQASDAAKMMELGMQTRRITREDLQQLNKRKTILLYDSLSASFEALRGIVFSERYKQTPSLRITTEEILNNPANDTETMLANCSTAIKQISMNPHNIHFKAVFNTLFKIRNLLGEKKETPAPETPDKTKPKEFNLGGLIKKRKEDKK